MIFVSGFDSGATLKVVPNQLLLLLLKFYLGLPAGKQ